MKALTISQPYASLIASGEKWIENRTWETNYRGEIAIHAGKGTQYMSRKELAAVPNGCIIATATLVACVPMKMILHNNSVSELRKRRIPETSLNWSEVARHKYAEGPFCWILADIKKLETPVVINGAQGLWEWDQ